MSPAGKQANCRKTIKNLRKMAFIHQKSQVMISGSFVWDKEALNKDFVPKHCAHAKGPVNYRPSNPGDEKYKHLIVLVRPDVQIYGQLLTGNI